MKKNLGSLLDFFLNPILQDKSSLRSEPCGWALGRSLLLIFMLFSHTLNASSLCNYYFDVSNENPFVKEGVKITFHASQKDKSSVMFYELTAPKSADYELYFLKKEEDTSIYHDRKVHYSYLLYPLKKGTLTLRFDFKVSQASDKSMEVFASGNRDVIKPMMTDETMIALEPLAFTVKSIPKSQLVGDYHLSMQTNTTEIDPLEQLNVTYTIKGDGYPSQLEHLLPEIEGVEQFLEVKKMKNGTQVFHYALSAKENFTIPAISLKCFSPTKNSDYTLTSKAIMIAVKKRTIKEVLDEENSLPDEAFSWDSLTPYLNALLLFLAGYITAKLNPLTYFSKKKIVHNPLHHTIKQTKDKKALLQLLLSTGDARYKPFIKKLEDDIYNKKKASFSKIKEALLKL